MAFERRTGAFVQQKSQQLITLVVYCVQDGCGEAIINRNLLEEHLINIHNIKRYRCLWPRCAASFDDFEPLGQHIRRNHGRNQRWSCTEVNCTKHFRSHNKLHRHLYHHHSKGLFRCGHPGCAFGPKPFRNTIYSHYRREHRPKGWNDPFAEATEEEWNRNNPCAICIRPMTRFSQNRRLPACPHVFHLRCLLRWMRGNRTCPSCRAQF